MRTRLGSALALLAACSLTAAADAQGTPDVPAPPGEHLEVPNLPPAGRARPLRSAPGLRVNHGRYTSIQVNVDANGQDTLGDAANEPSLAVDPTNPFRMAVGWRQFADIASDWRQAGWAWTADGGQTWTAPGEIDGNNFRSDPVLAADRDGVFYYNSLLNTGSFSCTVFRSFDGGATWDNGVYARGGDKQWMAIDTTAGIGSGNIYAYWTQFWSICGPGHFTRSTNGGQSFEACTRIPGTPQWGTLAVGPDGEVYVCGDGFVFARSTTLRDAAAAHAWDYSTTVNLGGSMAFALGPNPAGLLGQVWVAVDHSEGPTRGYVYLLCSVDPPGPDPLDVMFAGSTNGGYTWSAPQRINDDAPDANAWQWFGTLSVAPNGRLDAVWYDTRGDPGTISQVYYASSTDAGHTWSPNEPVTPPFDPHQGYPQQQKIGDYIQMISDARGASLAFAATFVNNEHNVFYLRLGEPLCTDAGTVALPGPTVPCAGELALAVNDCGLNLDPERTETVQVTVTSSSEPAGEIITLSESAPGSADFRGVLAVSTSDAPGVLQVAPDGLVTATYIDSDNGAGGIGIPVSASATVECAAPLISNVRVTDVRSYRAQVAFDTDQPAVGQVLYGPSCGEWSGQAADVTPDQAATIDMAVLAPETTYAFAVQATDESGNVTLDDHGGQCYQFTTTRVPDYFTEQFTSAAANDLAFQQLTFAPNASVDRYAACARPIEVLPIDPAGGTPLELTDDSHAYIELSAGQAVRLFGVDYGGFYVGSNGYLTFGAGDANVVETPARHFALPRVAALFDDLDPEAGGSVVWQELDDRVVVTWLAVPEFGTENANTLQVELLFSGVVRISYLALAAQDGLAGLSPGGGAPLDFGPSDLSALGPHCVAGDMNCDGLLNFADINRFVQALATPAAWHAAYPECNYLNGDINGDAAVDFRDINRFVTLLSSQ